MKKLLFSFVVFLALLIVGCQENSITDPLQISGNADKTSDAQISGTLELSRTLTNPYNVLNSYFDIEGTIDYNIKIRYLDPIPPAMQQVLSLQLTVNGELTSVCTVCAPPVDQTFAGSVSAETNDVINILDDSQHSIIKTFRIQKRSDNMVLKCSLQVTTTGLVLENMWLELLDYTDSDSSN